MSRRASLFVYHSLQSMGRETLRARALFPTFPILVAADGRVEFLNRPIPCPRDDRRRPHKDPSQPADANCPLARSQLPPRSYRSGRYFRRRLALASSCSANGAPIGFGMHCNGVSTHTVAKDERDVIEWFRFYAVSTRNARSIGQQCAHFFRCASAGLRGDYQQRDFSLRRRCKYHRRALDI